MFLNGNFFNTSSFSKDMIRNIAKNIAETAPNKTYDCFEIIAAKFNCLYSFIGYVKSFVYQLLLIGCELIFF